MWSGWILVSLSRTSTFANYAELVSELTGQFHSRYRDEASRYQVPGREDHILVRA
jgi:hypothetical protein